MALFIDRKFALLAGMKLSLFKQKGDYLFNFRCPVCGDSKKNKIKTRGYFYRKKDSLLYACHNCFGGETTVLTKEYGIVPFTKIVNKSVTILAKDGIWREAYVRKFGRQMLFKYTFKDLRSKNEYSVRATEDHKWFIEEDGKERSIISLDVGDKLKNPPVLFGTSNNVDAIIHGIIYGDGTLIRRGVKQYFSIRICKKDSARKEIEEYFKLAGYNVTSPKSYNGDSAAQGKMRNGNYKELPQTLDPDYIAGFVYGWWLADGTKDSSKTVIRISTIHKDAVEWLEVRAPYLGFRHRKTFVTAGDRVGSYVNGKNLYTVVLGNMKAKVVSKELDEEEDVFCVIEPVTHSFTLGNGLLTGNCNTSMSLGSFLREYDPALFQQYQLETYIENGSVRPSMSQQKAIQKKEFRPTIKLPSIASLPVDHTARKYVTGRKIPVVWWQEIYYADDFKVFCEETFHEDRLSEKGLRVGEARLVIPWYTKNGELAGVQGRTLSGSAVRYITIKADEDGDKLFGFHKINFKKPIYVLEGPIDSMFLSNAVATMDSALWRAAPLVGNDAIYVYDNEARNKQVVNDIRKTIEKGFKVVIWPQWIHQKDINDMVLDGVDVVAEIETHVYDDLRARLEFDQWRKV